MRKNYLLLVFFSLFLTLLLAISYVTEAQHPKKSSKKSNSSVLMAQETTAATTSETASTRGKRVITFKNSCPFPVHFAFVGGALKNSGGDLIRCANDDQCPLQTRCNKDVGQCFWVMPKPQDGNYQLESGKEKSITFHAYDYAGKLSTQLIWSGLFTARADCDGTSCKVADCLPFGGKTDCAPGTGVQQPATQAEFTLQTTDDYYDVEVINGVSIPIEMAPSSEQERQPIPAPADKDAAYWCGSPGGVKTMTTDVGPCTWNKFMPPSNDYLWVTPGGVACHAGNECSGEEICGLSFSRETNEIKKTCGKFLGFWTANEICGVSRGTHGAPFHCENTTNLQKCAAGELNESCYTQGAKNTCCGCINWHTLGLTIPPTTHQCEAINPMWIDAVLPTLKWIKEKCPTIYTYPYDDPSSTFQCSNATENKINTVNYTITFCPGGETTSLPKCASTADCAGHPGTTCKAGMCVPGIGVGCNAPFAPKCPANHVCNADGTCQPFSQGPPTPPSRCDSDEECKNKDPNKPICNKTNGQCVAHEPPPSGGCKSSKDCPSNTPLCVFAPGHESGNCQAGISCSTHANCGGGECVDNLCVEKTGCNFPQGRCSWSGGTILVACPPSGRCPMEAVKKECESDQECKDKDPNKPLCRNGTCVAEPPPPSKGCNSNSDCAPGKECLKNEYGSACITPGVFCMPGQMCPGQVPCPPSLDNKLYYDDEHKSLHCPAS